MPHATRIRNMEKQADSLGLVLVGYLFFYLFLLNLTGAAVWHFIFGVGQGNAGQYLRCLIVSFVGQASSQ